MAAMDHKMRSGVCVVCGPEGPRNKDGRCREGARLRRRESYAALTPEVRAEERRRAGLAFKYGITRTRYNALLEAQGGTCAVCGEPPKGRELDVDHDHACCSGSRSCGACVRGLLCSPCNRAIGYARDRPAVLRAAAAYLER